jgi:hypothetical protein
MDRTSNVLRLCRETVRELTREEMAEMEGGIVTPTHACTGYTLGEGCPVRSYVIELCYSRIAINGTGCV